MIKEKKLQKQIDDLVIFYGNLNHKCDIQEKAIKELLENSIYLNKCYS